MSGLTYLLIAAAIAAGGFLARRWGLVLAALVLWGLGLALAAIAGAFHATTEDSSGAHFFYVAVPTMLWIVALITGTALGRTVRWLARRARREPSTSRTPLPR